MNLLFLHNRDDLPYLAPLKNLTIGHKVFLREDTPFTSAELDNWCNQRDIAGIFTTNGTFVKKHLHLSKFSLDNWEGSLIDFGQKKIPLVIVSPLDHVHKVTYGKHLLERFLSKLTQPGTWPEEFPFSWGILNEGSCESAFNELLTSEFIAVDIETRRWHRSIICVCYTGVWRDKDGKWKIHTYVLPLTNTFFVAWMRKFNQLPSPKLMQNGKYDNAYFVRYNAPVYNWLFDTAHLFHSYYSELPKSLDFIAAYTLRRIRYWKADWKTGNVSDLYEYNARDGWATACTFLALMSQIPDWVRRNYLIEFPLVFACFASEMEGFAVDKQEYESVDIKVAGDIDKALAAVRKMVGIPNFNPSSPQQVLKLLHVLGHKKVEDTQEVTIKKCQFEHPVSDRVLEAILDYRGLRKLRSTYIKKHIEEDEEGDKVPIFFPSTKGTRFYYSLNPHMTDTARLASNESAYWCGNNVQNQPRGPIVKSFYVADDDYLLGSVDYPQSETRCTAYEAQELRMIALVESPQDFHAANGEMIFGIPYADVYDDVKKKTKLPEIRDLYKRVNHGWNYNMHWLVLIDTMGLKNIYKAKMLLKLPQHWGPKEIAEHLISLPDKAYPRVRGSWYNEIKNQVNATRMLVSALGWTRYCFGQPTTNRQALNSYVAHVPQNLSVGLLNQSYMRVFYHALSLPSIGGKRPLRLKPQIHDEVMFQYLAICPEIPDKVAELCRAEVMVKGRKLVINPQLVAGKRRWSELK